MIEFNENLGSTAELGFSIKSQIGKDSTLFNPSQASNFIYKVTAKEFRDSEITAINNIVGQSKIQDRVNAIIDTGGVLEFLKTEKNVFQNNLVLIDSCLPRILAFLAIMFNEYRASNLQTLVNIMEDINPLKYDISTGHKFYTYKVKRLLTDIALGMTSKRVWTGILDATGGFLIVKENGDILCYHIYNRNDFEDYLLNNTRLINPSSTRNNFGKLYRENGELFFKLNMQIRFLV